MDDSKQTILYILHDGGGGTIHTTNDLVNIVSNTYVCIVVKLGLNYGNIFKINKSNIIENFSIKFSNEWSIEKKIDKERILFFEYIIKLFNPSIVHTRSFICSSTSILKIFKKYGIKIVNSFHDFHLICPNIQLVDFSEAFCEGDCNKHNHPVSHSLDCPVSQKWFKTIPPLRGHFKKIYADTNHRNLEYCDKFITTSQSTKSVLLQNFPNLSEKKFHIIEHGRDFSKYTEFKKRITRRSINIVVFGVLNRPKGLSIIESILEHNTKCELKINILGNPKNSFFDFLQKKGAILHGEYQRDHLPYHIARINPFLAIIPSLWPETFCHTLTEAWALGIPVLGSSLGAVGERIRYHNGGWTLPPVDGRHWFSTIMDILHNKEDYDAKAASVAKIDFKTASQMANEYLELYRSLTPHSVAAFHTEFSEKKAELKIDHMNIHKNSFITKAQDHINHKNWIVAEKILYQLINDMKNSTPIDAYWLLSIAYRKQNLLEESSKILETGLLLEPNNNKLIKEKEELVKIIKFHKHQNTKKNIPEIIHIDTVKLFNIDNIPTHRTCIVMPCTNKKQGESASSILVQRAGCPTTVIVVLDTKRIGFINIVNEIFRKTNSEYIVYLAQDSFPCRKWLHLAEQALDQTQKGLLAFNDGKWQGKLASFGMARRSWINKIYKNSLFFQNYISHSADNELTTIARATDNYEYNPNIVLMEVDYEKENKIFGNTEDRERFISRCKSGFDSTIDTRIISEIVRDFQIYI